MKTLSDTQCEALAGGSLVTLPTINTNIDLNLVNQLQNATTLAVLGSTARTGQLQGSSIVNLPLFFQRQPWS